MRQRTLSDGVAAMAAALTLALLAAGGVWGDGVSSIHVRDFLPKGRRVGLPEARAVGNGAALFIVGDRFFEESQGLSSTGDSTLSDVTRDRVVLDAPHARGRESRGRGVVAQLCKAGDRSGVADAPAVVITDASTPGAAPLALTFDKYLTDPAIFPNHAELNDIRYHISIHGVDPKGYNFVGFARSHGVVYVGVYYVDGGPSDQSRGRNEAAFRLFCLRQSAGRWRTEVVALPAVPGAPSEEVYGADATYFRDTGDWPKGPPLLDVADDDGDLYLIYRGILWRRGPSASWTKRGEVAALLPPPPTTGLFNTPRDPKDSFSAPARATEYYLRGRWLILESQMWPSRQRCDFLASVYDVRTLSLVRTITWSEFYKS